MTLDQIFAGWFSGAPKDIVPGECKFFFKMQNTFIKRSNSTQYKRLFKPPSQSKVFEGHHILSPKIWGKTFTDWLKICSERDIFSMLYKLLYPFFSLLKPCST